MARKNFLFMVTGRIPNDDDDSAMMIKATTEKSAKTKFEKALLGFSGLTKNEIKDLTENWGEAVFVINCIRSGVFLPDGNVKLDDGVID
jgi:hypothetical protein